VIVRNVFSEASRRRSRRGGGDDAGGELHVTHGVAQWSQYRPVRRCESERRDDLCVP